MANQKPFYGSRKNSDTAKFNESLQGLNSLYSQVKGGKNKLASELGVSRSTLTRWISGKSKPKDMDKFNSITKKYSSLKKTISNEQKSASFIERKTKEVKKQKSAKLTPPKIVVQNLFTWLSKNFEKEYGEIRKYEYLVNMLIENDFHFVKFISDNPKEGLFLRSADEYIMGNSFVYFVGVKFEYPFTKEQQQIFFRRMVRINSGLRENPTEDTQESIDTLRRDIENARGKFYSGDENKRDKENFIGYYFM